MISQLACACPFDVDAMLADRKRRKPWWRDGNWQPEPTVQELRFYAWFRDQCKDTWWCLGLSSSSEGGMINDALKIVASELKTCRDPRPWYEQRLAAKVRS